MVTMCYINTTHGNYSTVASISFQRCGGWRLLKDGIPHYMNSLTLPQSGKGSLCNYVHTMRIHSSLIGIAQHKQALKLA